MPARDLIELPKRLLDACLAALIKWHKLCDGLFMPGDGNHFASIHPFNQLRELGLGLKRPKNHFGIHIQLVVN